MYYSRFNENIQYLLSDITIIQYLSNSLLYDILQTIKNDEQRCQSYAKCNCIQHSRGFLVDTNGLLP